MAHHDAFISLLDGCIENQVPITSLVPFEYINMFTKSDYSEMREKIAKVLAFEGFNEDVITCLCQLATDSDFYVRLEAIDSLCAFSCCKSFNTLCKAIQDEDELIRAYALRGVALIGKEILPDKTLEILRDARMNEQSVYVQVSIFEGLYILGNCEVLDSLIKLFYNNHYLVQCVVIRALLNILNTQNKGVIMQFVCSLDVSNYPTAVSQALLELQDSIA